MIVHKTWFCFSGDFAFSALLQRTFLGEYVCIQSFYRLLVAANPSHDCRSYQRSDILNTKIYRYT